MKNDSDSPYKLDHNVRITLAVLYAWKNVGIASGPEKEEI